MRLPLTQGFYEAPSFIADAQACLNCYPERNPQDAESSVTVYGRPGLTLLAPGIGAPARGLYWANNDRLYYVAGNAVYSVNAQWQQTQIGTIGTYVGPVSMADNGTTLVLVDGSANGYQITLSTNAFSPISSANNSPPSPAVYAFYGGTRVDVLDGFLIFNYPNTQTFYCTYDNEAVFDSLYFAEKNGFSDQLVVVIVTNREIWLIGQRTSEPWFNAGGSAFPFQITPGPFVQHGAAAAYSVAQINSSVYFLSQDQAGNGIAIRLHGYQAARISTHAIEAIWKQYGHIDDAIGYCYQFNGHEFWSVTFPFADATWVWDETCGLWHEEASQDANANLHRVLHNCAAFAYGVNVVADWQTGALYKLDPTASTDDGNPIPFRRGFPHTTDDGKRRVYERFTLDMQALPTAANINLRWSDDRGYTWSAPVAQSYGGGTLTQPQWRRTGMARDRVFEVFGTLQGQLAINGAWIDVKTLGS